MKKTIKKIIAAAVPVAILLIICAAYVSDYYRADKAAVSAMNAPGIKAEKAEDTLAFIPENPRAGFVFYPGGKVEYTAYAPLMQALAEHDILCVIAEMPFNLAVLDMNAADGIPGRYPEVERWFIGGHSLGGSMAASHAAKHTGDYEGLVLLAAYSTADLSQSPLEVVSVYGSEDGVLNMGKYEKYEKNLPAACKEYVIDGGCHAGFGAYGPQKGDGTPSISSEEQIRQTALILAEAFG